MKPKLSMGCVIIFTAIFSFCFSSCEKDDSAAENTKPIGVESRKYSVSTWAYASPYHYTDLNVPELTAENINSSVVVAYFSTDGNSWRALPYTQYTPAANYHMGFLVSVGNVRITWFYNSTLSSGDNPTEYYSKAIEVKVVVIPSSERLRKPNINLGNYNEVKAAYELKD